MGTRGLLDLIVTMDDATSEHYSMFFVEEEGTASSFKGVSEVIEKKGLFSSFYSDRQPLLEHTQASQGAQDKSDAILRITSVGIEQIPPIHPRQAS